MQSRSLVEVESDAQLARRTQLALLVAGLCYIPWGLLFRLGGDSVVDPMSERVILATLFAGLGLLLSWKAGIRRLNASFLLFVAVVATIHHAFLVARNLPDSGHLLAYLLVALISSYLMPSRKALLVYFSICMAIMLTGSVMQPSFLKWIVIAGVITSGLMLYTTLPAQMWSFESLRETETRLESIFNSLPEVVYLVSLDGEVLAINEKVERFGKKHTDLIQNDFSELWPDDFRRDFEALHRRAYETGVSIPSEMTLMTVGGPRLHSVIVSPIRGPKGGLVAYLGVLTDIHERRRAVERLAESKRFVDRVFASIQEMIIVVDLKCKIWEVNPRSVEVLGYAPSELQEKSIEGLLPRGDAMDAESLRELIFQGMLKEFRTYYISKLGEKIPVSITADRIFGDEGEVAGAVLLAKDERDSRLVHELRETQMQLVQSAKLASLGEMSSGIAHELNQPLFLIQGVAEQLRDILREEVPGGLPRMERYFSEILENVERMNRIIRHLRDFSRQSKQTMNPFSLNETIFRSLILFNEQLKLSNIQIQVKASDGEPQIMGDPNRIEQVFINLIANSRDAIDAKEGQPGGVIRIESRTESDKALITLSDDGIGIPESQLGRIFDPFFTTKDPGKGTGLGLSISHGIIKDHLGKIHCTSRPGEGTAITVELPLSKTGPRA